MLIAFSINLNVWMSKKSLQVLFYKDLTFFLIELEKVSIKET